MTWRGILDSLPLGFIVVVVDVKTRRADGGKFAGRRIVLLIGECSSDGGGGGILNGR